MIAEETSLSGVVVVRAPVREDSRGFFTETFREDEFARVGLPVRFAQDNHSRSRQHVLRGLHLQLENPQGKLVTVVAGTIFDVAVDVRRTSPNFGRWVGLTLSAGDGRHLWVPAGFAHGFLVLSETADVTYKCTTLYHGPSSRAIQWSDPQIGIDWPLVGAAPILSDADAAAPALASGVWLE